MSDPRFPIGKFHAPETITTADRAEWIETLSQPCPCASGCEAMGSLTPAQFDTPYREGRLDRPAGRATTRWTAT